VLELHHNALSTCSQKVRLVLAEKGLDFASHEIDLMAGGQHDPEYVKLNPNHVVPTLVHDGHVILESSLILRYLRRRPWSRSPSVRATCCSSSPRR
jgi:glutathione S-transferase